MFYLDVAPSPIGRIGNHGYQSTDLRGYNITQLAFPQDTIEVIGTTAVIRTQHPMSAFSWGTNATFYALKDTVA